MIPIAASPAAAARTAAPRRAAARTATFIGSPRTAGPQPRDVLRLALPSRELSERPVALRGRHAHAGEAARQRAGSLEADLDVAAGEAGEPPGRAVPRLEHQRLLDAPDQPATELEVLLPRELTEHARPVADRPRVHRAGEARGLGPFPSRVREHVEVGERQRLDQAHGLAEVRVALAGEPRDERSEEHTSELQSPCNLVC